MSAAKRRKQRTARKDDMIRIRVTAEQRRKFEAAAEAAHLDLSTWMRVVCEERAAGK
jgi:uncharacterized protein (DUF1778 family)